MPATLSKLADYFVGLERDYGNEAVLGFHVTQLQHVVEGGGIYEDGFKSRYVLAEENEPGTGWAA